MIIKSIQRNVVESHDFKSEIATIDANEMRYISSLLRNNYSNVILATARETIANAVDANKGASARVKITAPTRLSPTFVVRDFGAGLSETDLFGLYTKYGRSTKRGDNASIGGFGIGRFAPLSYTDSFTVTSRHDGTEIVISVYVDEGGDTRFTKLSETAASQPSGLEVCVAVKSQDIASFEYEIKKVIYFSNEEFVCKHFSREVPKWVMKNDDWGVLDSMSNTTTIVMGGVAYPLNLDNLNNDAFAKSKTYKAFQNSSISSFLVFFFPVGSVALHHSRENLEYNTQTKNFIARAISKLEIEVKAQMQKEIDLISDSQKFFAKLYSFSSTVYVGALCSDLDFSFTDANKNVIKINSNPIVPLAVYKKSRNTGNLVRVSKKSKILAKIIEPNFFYTNSTHHIVINDNVKDVKSRVNGLMITKKIEEVIYVVSLADAESKLLYKHNSFERIHLASKLTPISISSKKFGSVRKIFCNSSYHSNLKEKVPTPTDPFYYLDAKHVGGSSYDIIFGGWKQFNAHDLRSLVPIADRLGLKYDKVYAILDKTDVPAHAINLADAFMPKYNAAIAQFKSLLNLKEEIQLRRNALPTIAYWGEYVRKQLPNNHPISVYFDAWNADENTDNHGFSNEQKTEFEILTRFSQSHKYENQSNIPAVDSKIVEKINKEALTIKQTYPMMFALFEGRYNSYSDQPTYKLALDYINLVDNRNS